MASTTSLILEMDSNSAYQHIFGSLTKTGVEPTFQTPPNRVNFTLWKNQWGFKYGFDGEATISQLPDKRSNAVIKLEAGKNTVIYAVGTALVLAVIFLWLLGVWGVIVAIVAGVGLFWYYVVDFPEKILKNIRAAANVAPVTPTTYPSRSTPQSAARFCWNCGTQIPAPAIFCLQCGSKQQ